MSILKTANVCPKCGHAQAKYNTIKCIFTCSNCNNEYSIDELPSEYHNINPNDTWHTTNPPKTMSERTMLLITIKTIVNTEHGIEDTDHVYPALFHYDNDVAIWDIIDGIDSFTLKCPANNAVINNITYYDDEADAPDKFLKEYHIILAWRYMPDRYMLENNTDKYVIVGYNKENRVYEKIAEHENLDILKTIIRRIINDMNARNVNEYPFIINNHSIDRLEIYKKNEIGQPDKRILFTSSE